MTPLYIEWSLLVVVVVLWENLYFNDNTGFAAMATGVSHSARNSARPSRMDVSV